MPLRGVSAEAHRAVVEVVVVEAHHGGLGGHEGVGLLARQSRSDGGTGDQFRTLPKEKTGGQFRGRKAEGGKTGHTNSGWYSSSAISAIVCPQPDGAPKPPPRGVVFPSPKIPVSRRMNVDFPHPATGPMVGESAGERVPSNRAGSKLCAGSR